MDEIIRLTPIVDPQRRDFLINVAKSIVTSLPEKEDRITSVVDVGDSIANLIGEAAGLKGAAWRIQERKEYRKTITENRRKRRNQIIAATANETPQLLNVEIEAAYRSKTLREFLAQINSK